MKIDTTQYRLWIDRNACSGCNLCEYIFPGFYDRGDQLVKGWAYEHNFRRIHYAIETCPENALRFDVEEKNAETLNNTRQSSNS